MLFSAYRRFASHEDSTATVDGAMAACWAQEKNEALRAAAAAANKGGSANEARLQDREAYITSLQACAQLKSGAP